MKNPGQMQMLQPEPEKQKPTIGVETRNEWVKTLYHQIVGKPKHKLGEIVVATDLGLKVKILERDQIAVITKVFEEADIETFGGKDYEIQTFSAEGSLMRMAVEGRFIKNQKEKAKDE